MDKFNLKEFLVENELTTNSQPEGEEVEGEKEDKYAVGTNVENILNLIKRKKSELLVVDQKKEIYNLLNGIIKLLDPEKVYGELRLALTDLYHEYSTKPEE